MPKPRQILAMAAPDLTGTYDAGCLSVKINAHQSGETEIILTNTDIGFVDMTVCGQSQHHGVFRNGLRRIAGHAHNGNSVFLRSIQIYVIKAGTAHQNQSDPFLAQSF